MQHISFKAVIDLKYKEMKYVFLQENLSIIYLFGRKWYIAVSLQQGTESSCAFIGEGSICGGCIAEGDVWGPSLVRQGDMLSSFVSIRFLV